MVYIPCILSGNGTVAAVRLDVVEEPFYELAVQSVSCSEWRRTLIFRKLVSCLRAMFTVDLQKALLVSEPMYFLEILT